MTFDLRYLSRADRIRGFLQAGELICTAVEDSPDTLREGLRETPERFAKAWEEWTSGYDVDPASVLKAFEDGAEGYHDLVIVKDIPFYSKCEHHLADIFGTVTIGYVPHNKIVGLSKMPRLVEVYARRLQVQERMTTQIAEAFMKYVAPRFVGVQVTARHMCMESRGINKPGSETVTRRCLGDQNDWRAEFLDQVKGK